MSGQQATDLVRARMAGGLFETWFAGEHATDPNATGQQGGYALDNGQHDTYDNADTVSLEQALTIVEQVLERGRPPAGVSWHTDR